MSAAPSLDPPRPAAAPARQQPSRPVVGVPVRVFHALYALSFAGAYVTADSERWRAWHVALGYGLAGLLVLRVLYGLVGPRQARLGPRFRTVGAAAGWLRTTAQAVRSGQWARVDGRQAQNLLMAGLVVALLLLAPPLVLSGHAVYEEWVGGLWEDALEHVHEFLGESMGALALAHIALVLALSVLRRRNLVLPMVTGRAAAPGPARTSPARPPAPPAGSPSRQASTP